MVSGLAWRSAVRGWRRDAVLSRWHDSVVDSTTGCHVNSSSQIKRNRAHSQRRRPYSELSAGQWCCGDLYPLLDLGGCGHSTCVLRRSMECCYCATVLRRPEIAGEVPAKGVRWNHGVVEQAQGRRPRCGAQIQGAPWPDALGFSSAVAGHDRLAAGAAGARPAAPAAARPRAQSAALGSTCATRAAPQSTGPPQSFLVGGFGGWCDGLGRGGCRGVGVCGGGERAAAVPDGGRPGARWRPRLRTDPY